MNPTKKQPAQASFNKKKAEVQRASEDSLGQSQMEFGNGEAVGGGSAEYNRFDHLETATDHMSRGLIGGKIGKTDTPISRQPTKSIGRENHSGKACCNEDGCIIF